MQHKSRLHQRLSNNINELPALAETVRDFGRRAGWENAVAMQVNLVIEELIVNAISHGYASGRDGNIEVAIETDGSEISICIEDDGDAFDPFTAPRPDVSAPVEKRPIGELGIHLVRSYMDACSYRRLDGHNRIELRKRIS